MQNYIQVHLLVLTTAWFPGVAKICFVFRGLHTQHNLVLTENSSPPSVRKNGTRKACSLARTLMNFWKLATLLRERNWNSLSLRSRGCIMFIRCSLCDHVIHPAVASSVRNATSASIRSSNWWAVINSWRIWASSNGRTSPYPAPISAILNYTVTID